MAAFSGRAAVVSGDVHLRTLFSRIAPAMLFGAALVLAVLVTARPAQAALPCNGCHGMPPLDSADGSRNPNTGAVAGNHQIHNPTPSVPADCVKCHGTGVLTYVSGHMDFTVQLVANVNDSTPAASYLINGVAVTSQPYVSTPALGTCASVNCHFRRATPVWGTHTPASAAKCGSCHGFPPADGSHVEHGNVLGTGADACASCHAAYTDGSHALATGTRGLLVRFGKLPNSGGAYSGNVSYPTYLDNTSRTGTCSSVYCHSDGKGDFRTPTWGGATLGCKGCHGNDSAPAFASRAGEPNYVNQGPGMLFANSHLGHVSMAGLSCASCHAGNSHVDGVIDIAPGDGASFAFTPPMTCSNVSCHGLQTPPATWGGYFAPVTQVGAAHPQHGQATPERAGLPCDECHKCPGPTPVFGALAYTKNVNATFDATTHSCTTYCHGAAMKSPPAVAPVWSSAAPTYSCTGCHGAPPPAPHPQMTACSACHGKLGASHINGTLDITIDPALGCAGCHGYPPATGAHVAHFGLAGAATSGQYGETTVLQDRYPSAGPTTAPAVYAFGCGNCHPVDSGRHFDGNVDVELYSAIAPPTSIKARSASTAAYDPASGTCSNVYCHSSGQESPKFVTTPGWASGAKLSCTGCHTNPPSYPSGGAGTGDANTHVVVADDGWYFGHFLGLPGPWHGSKHGAAMGPGDDAAPMTCQTCHFDTTDPSNTAPGGFYYLDTSGDYLPPGVDPSNTNCTVCHKANTAAPLGTGKVLPLRHVNGARDVVFDPRTTMPEAPALPWLPAGAARPTKPYWATAWNTMVPAGAVSSGGTVSFDLAGASYDSMNKTCSNVACHLSQTQVQWGTSPVGFATCDACHQYGM
jgi:predicted CxxxxCH...CXXCH cytochrome family protein